MYYIQSDGLPESFYRLMRLYRRLLFSSLVLIGISCNSNHNGVIRKADLPESVSGKESSDNYNTESSILVLPKQPAPGKPFRILVTGGKSILHSKVIVSSTSGELKSVSTRTGDEFPFWKIDDFSGEPAGSYSVKLISGEKETLLEFMISDPSTAFGTVSDMKKLTWDGAMEATYSAWVNALFHNCSEQASWSSLNEVTENQDQNFLYNYLSLDEDNPAGKKKLLMQPDCADNPFFLRAYFAWKLGLPFGYHICDRGYVGKNPKAGQWIKNESPVTKNDPVASFNSFLRKMRDGVHSGTARTALDDENSDYYPVPLGQEDLRAGTVFADPYGHTLILTGRVPQTKDRPGILLAVDAQPDGTVGIKRFWKGNFLFNTSGVIGEPGFKAFRPISIDNGNPRLLKNEELTKEAGFVPYSLQQKKMETAVFYHTMERLINPKPLDPESALLDLIQALHEQLLVRITSVANGEAYFNLHPGSVIPMPSNATGIFLAGGQWEDFSTPNRDLRLLIAIDAVLDFPDVVADNPGDFNLHGNTSREKIRQDLQMILEKKTSELSVSYAHSDASLQKLTVSEILKRRDAFEMAYNPNDGIEIRWGAPENSEELKKCHRRAPANQVEKMQVIRTWFSKRLHPPT